MFKVSIWYRPSTYPQGSPPVLGPQDTKRAREALKDQSETARRALLHQEGEFLAACHQHEAVGRQILVSALARTNEVHSYNVQIQVRQLEQEADARFSQDRGISYLDFRRKHIKLLKISETLW